MQLRTILNDRRLMEYDLIVNGHGLGLFIF